MVLVFLALPIVSAVIQSLSTGWSVDEWDTAHSSVPGSSCYFAASLYSTASYLTEYTFSGPNETSSNNAVKTKLRLLFLRLCVSFTPLSNFFPTDANVFFAKKQNIAAMMHKRTWSYNYVVCFEYMDSYCVF